MEKSFKSEISPLSYIPVTPNYSFAHASLAEPEEFPYIKSFNEAEPCFKHMESQLSFIGHTHIPCCFCQNTRSADYLLPGKMMLEKGQRYLLNPGSIGQPRDRDPRLSFGIFDEKEYSFEIARLDYDNKTAAGKIGKAGLPSFLADHLL